MKFVKWTKNFSSKENLENHMKLLLLKKESNSHYIYIKDFDRFMCSITKHKDNSMIYKNSFILDELLTIL